MVLIGPAAFVLGLKTRVSVSGCLPARTAIVPPIGRITAETADWMEAKPTSFPVEKTGLEVMEVLEATLLGF